MKQYKLKTPAGEQGRAWAVDYGKELNPQQIEAVRTLEGPLLVIAGAGSGKTRTLVYRVARLVESGIDPGSILLLTFTRKAAGEMLRRAAAILDERCAKVSGGTFHSFANEILRKYAGLLGYRNNFTILDQTDSEDVVNLVRAELGFHQKGRNFPKKKALHDIISKARNKFRGHELRIKNYELGNVGPNSQKSANITISSNTLQDTKYKIQNTNQHDSIARIIESEYPNLLEFTDDIGSIAADYDRYKKARSLMDYDDLLINLRQLLARFPVIRKKLSQKYRYIMVDEYQDTNPLQADIAALLASEHGNIMAVGDDSQSIYAFRGADFRNIIDFPKRFQGARIITIEENYRSTQPILDLTNELIESAKEKYSKKLFTRKPGENLPAFIEARDEQEQSRFVAQKVLELAEEGIPLSEIAVLIRAGWHSNDLEVEFARRRIPFVKYGGFKFIETAHVKDVLAHLRVIENPLDSVSWLRILLLVEGIGPRTAQAIISELMLATSYQPAPVRRPANLSVRQEAKHLPLSTRGQEEQASPPPLQGGGREGVLMNGYAEIIKKFPRHTSRLNDLFSVLERISDISMPLIRGQESGNLDNGPSSKMRPADRIAALLGYYEPILARVHDDHLKRKSDLDSLIRIAERYKRLDKFLTDLTLEPIDASQKDTEPDDKAEKLTISTIHSAKGLEWHSVFLIFANDGMIPSARSLDSEDQIEEERRLLYVALTRSKQNLFIVKPDIQFSARGYFDNAFYGMANPSRFLIENDLIGRLMETWVLESGDEDVIDIEDLEKFGRTEPDNNPKANNEIEYIAL